MITSDQRHSDIVIKDFLMHSKVYHMLFDLLKISEEEKNELIEYFTKKEDYKMCKRILELYNMQ